jgi:polyisoprenoid-binding protein YceI
MKILLESQGKVLPELRGQLTSRKVTGEVTQDLDFIGSRDFSYPKQQ